MTEVIEHSVPPETPDPAAMQRPGLAGEWRIGRELMRLGLSSRQLQRVPRGDGAPVLLIPGWRAPEASMAPLKWFLNARGYDARHWGFGTNRGYPERDSERLAQQLPRLVEATGRRIALVGWSLGGVIARETARLAPELVALVITYGTPVIGGPTHTLAAGTYGEAECKRVSRRVEELDGHSPIMVPIAAVFTRSDSIVSWPACIDRVSPNVRHFEVGSTHLSMGVDPTVWQLVASQLRKHTLREMRQRDPT
jgi:pimeloyl-ACP methyl ester carboxylesterase